MTSSESEAAEPSAAPPPFDAPPAPFAPPSYSYAAPPTPEAPPPPVGSPVSVEPPADPAAAEPAPTPPAPPRRRRWPLVVWILVVTLLTLALAAVSVYLYLVLQRLDEAIERIDEQQEIIDTKETFSAAMRELVATAHGFDGVPFATLVPTATIEEYAARGWEHRWQPRLLERDIVDVRATAAELATTLATAGEQAATNATGSTVEGVLDSLGQGFVTTLIDDADAICDTDVLGCVQSSAPYTVHFDAAEFSARHMTDWIWTGVAYHEFAHVLQFTNPGPTEEAAAAFGGDWETMADCYALTVLPGWTLDHRVYISATSWWNVSVGYGHTCDEGQRQVIRDWVAQVGYRSAPIEQ